MERSPNNILGYTAAILVWPILASKQHMAISQAVQGAMACGLLSCTSDSQTDCLSLALRLIYKLTGPDYLHYANSDHFYENTRQNALAALTNLSHMAPF